MSKHPKNPKNTDPRGLTRDFQKAKLSELVHNAYTVHIIHFKTVTFTAYYMYCIDRYYLTVFLSRFGAFLESSSAVVKH